LMMASSLRTCARSRCVVSAGCTARRAAAACVQGLAISAPHGRLLRPAACESAPFGTASARCRTLGTAA
jgi:hypothetical protein